MGGIVGITVYDDRDFRGRNANFRNDVADLRPSGMNDRIVEPRDRARRDLGSLRARVVSAGAARCSRGTRTTCASAAGRGDLVDAAHPRRRRWRIPAADPCRQCRVGPAVEAASSSSRTQNFRGSSRVLNGPTPDLRALGFSDKAESLRLAARRGLGSVPRHRVRRVPAGRTPTGPTSAGLDD